MEITPIGHYKRRSSNGLGAERSRCAEAAARPLLLYLPTICTGATLNVSIIIWAEDTGLVVGGNDNRTVGTRGIGRCKAAENSRNMLQGLHVGFAKGYHKKGTRRTQRTADSICTLLDRLLVGRRNQSGHKRSVIDIDRVSWELNHHQSSTTFATPFNGGARWRLSRRPYYVSDPPVHFTGRGLAYTHSFQAAAIALMPHAFSRW